MHTTAYCLLLLEIGNFFGHNNNKCYLKIAMQKYTFLQNRNFGYFISTYNNVGYILLNIFLNIFEWIV